MSVKIRFLLPPPELAFVRRLRYEKKVDSFIRRHIGVTRKIDFNRCENPENNLDKVERFGNLQVNEPDSCWQNTQAIWGSIKEHSNGLILTENVDNEDGWTDAECEDEECADKDLSIIEWYVETRNQYGDCHCSESSELKTSISYRNNTQEIPTIYEPHIIDNEFNVDTIDNNTIVSDELSAPGAYVEIPFSEEINTEQIGIDDNLCESGEKKFEIDNNFRNFADKCFISPALAELSFPDEEQIESFWNYPVQPYPQSIRPTNTERAPSYEPTNTPQGFWNCETPIEQQENHYLTEELHMSRKIEEPFVELMAGHLGFWDYGQVQGLSSSEHVDFDTSSDIQAEQISKYNDTSEDESNDENCPVYPVLDDIETIENWNSGTATTDINAAHRPSSPTEFVNIPNIPAYPNEVEEVEISEPTFKYIVTIDVLKARIQALSNRDSDLYLYHR